MLYGGNEMKDDNEIKFTDAQSYLTQQLAKQEWYPDERTRIHSYEELDYIGYELFLYNILGLMIYEINSKIRMKLLISKDGESRKEAVQALQAMNEYKKGYHTGFQLLTEHLQEQQSK